MKFKVVIPMIAVCAVATISMTTHAGTNGQQKMRTKPVHTTSYSKSPEAAHAQLVEEFVMWENEYGATSSRHSTQHVAGHHVAESKVNKVREQLHQAMRNGDAAGFEKSLNKLEKLKPATWPRTEDYREMWSKMYQQQQPMHKRSAQ